MSHFDKIHMLPRLPIVRVANQNAQNSFFNHNSQEQAATRRQQQGEPELKHKFFFADMVYWKPLNQTPQTKPRL
jgi:hypothetical protein